MKIVKIKNPAALVAGLFYPKALDPVNIDTPDSIYAMDETGFLSPLAGFYKGTRIYFRFHESDIEEITPRRNK